MQWEEFAREPGAQILRYLASYALGDALRPSGEIAGVPFVVDENVSTRRRLFALGPHSG